jgi:hypothetical protein
MERKISDDDNGVSEIRDMYEDEALFFFNNDFRYFFTEECISHTTMHKNDLSELWFVSVR